MAEPERHERWPWAGRLFSLFVLGILIWRLVEGDDQIFVGVLLLALVLTVVIEAVLRARR